jgi:hypothetical protein
MAPYKLLTLGDSVMWGQGLASQHKFVQLVAGYLAGLHGPVAVAALAHSGAVVCDNPKPEAAHQAFLFGELPRSFPSIASQLEIAGQAAGYGSFLQPNSWDPKNWQALKADLGKQIAGYWQAGGSQPDLILLDGGINDLGALQIVVPWLLNAPDPCASPGAAPPQLAQGGAVERILGAFAAGPGTFAAFDPNSIQWMTDDQFKALIDRYVWNRMRLQVGRLAARFQKSRVVITGYFPIFTPGSIGGLAAAGAPAAAAVLFAPGLDRRHFQAALHWAFHPAVDQQALANRIVHQSALWYSYSTERLRQVVDEANQLHGNRFALADPGFGPDNGALAPDSWLWTFTSLLDEVIQKILELFGGGGAAPAVESLASRTAAAAPGGWEDVLGFAAGLALGASIATDEVGLPRASAATDYYVLSATGRSDPATNAFTGFKAGVASAGHPNLAGAQSYFAAIKKALG